MLRSLPACLLALLIGCTPIRPLDAPLDGSSERDAGSQQRDDASTDDSGTDASTDACVASTLDVCNGIDDDCDPSSADGSEDPMVGIACDGPDADSCAEGTSSCVGGEVVCDDATDDTLELCNGEGGGTVGADEDCDGSVDEDGAQGARAYYPDADSDGYGSDTGVRMACATPMEGRWQTRGGDCDDSDENVRPGRAEQCNAADDDCDGMIDDNSPCSGCETFYYGTSTYQICHRTSLPWSMARSGCMLGGYDLVVIDDAAEDAALNMEAQRVGGFNAELWIGLSRMTEGGEFTWVDGSALTYSHWASGQPNLTTASCGRIARMGEIAWYDAACTQNHDFICELPAAP